MSVPTNRIALLVFGYIHVEQKSIKLSGNVPDEIIYVIYDFYPVKRKHISLSVVGHQSSGKSTLCGRLLYDLKIVSNDELQKLKTLSKKNNQDSSYFAYIMDRSKAERSRGITISCSSKVFVNKLFQFTLQDVPGHKSFIKNTITGIAQSDISLLVISANNDTEIESLISTKYYKSNANQTLTHSQLCHAFGIKQLIVCVNKMDYLTVQYSQTRFNEIKKKTSTMLTTLGYKMDKIAFIPLCAFDGDNIVFKSKNMLWYKGFQVNINNKIVKGHTLFDALENIIIPPIRAINKPFRMAISGIYKIKNVGDVITGRVEQGTIKLNTKVKMNPTGCIGIINNIEIDRKSVNKAICGDNIGVNVIGLDSDNMPRVGDVMIIDSDETDDNPPRMTKEFTALISVQYHPGKLKCASVRSSNYGIEWHIGGFTPSIHVRTAKAPCQMCKIHWKKGASTNYLKQENATFVEAGDEAEVVFAPKLAICLCTVDECEPLGTFVAMDSNSLIMIGKIISVTYTEPYGIFS